MSDDFILHAEGLHTHYGQSHVLHGVGLSIRRGEAVGLLGRNGMGKTTLIRSLIGQLRATSGEVTVAGQRCRSSWKPGSTRRSTAPTRCGGPTSSKATTSAP